MLIRTIDFVFGSNSKLVCILKALTVSQPVVHFATKHKQACFVLTGNGIELIMLGSDIV